MGPGVEAVIRQLSREKNPVGWDIQGMKSYLPSYARRIINHEIKIPIKQRV